MLLATINSGTLIIALPDLERSLGTSLLQLVWVILAYMISSTVLVLTAGRLSDLFGRKKAYVGGFILFTLASFGAGFSGSGTELILWRILQGVGAAFLFANAAALVTDAFPKEQLGLAMGTNTMVAAAVPGGVAPADLRALASDVRGRLGARPGVVALFGADDAGKVSFVVATTAAARDAGLAAGKLVPVFAPAVGGRGGGKPDLAQGGGTDPSGVPAAIDALRRELATR